ncbi:hypothetical protein BDZ89DRAFT_1261005 [Hymenopellis radicata]|nr:hypothetical protein BDZ89DRAFT_1261005 [Hymenopellis radicata]
MADITSLNNETPTNDAAETHMTSTKNAVATVDTVPNSTGVDQDESKTISKEPEPKNATPDDTKIEDDTKTEDSDSEEEEDHPDTEKTKLQMGNFIKIYDSKEWSWIPYDPSKEETYRPVERDNYFYLDVRYRKAGGAVWRRLNTLLSFLRPEVEGFLKTIGNDFFDEAPECSLIDLYPHLKLLQKKLAEAKARLDAFDSENQNADKTLAFIKAIRFADFRPSTHGEVVTCLKDVVDHVQVVVGYVTQEFQPITDKLALVTSYGHIEFELRYTVWRKFFELAGSNVIDTDSTQTAIRGQKSFERSSMLESGRTIKNIWCPSQVRTAQALALSNGLPLSIAHVQVVLAAQEKFLDEFSSSDRLQ